MHKRLVALFFLSFSQLVFAGCPDAYSTIVQSTAPKSELAGYFVLTRKIGKGTFDDVTAQLPALQSMGVKFLWISPPNPQTTLSHPRYGGNDHGYWISAHGEVDPALGGEAGFQRLVEAAKARGIRICVDAVINHFGYGTHFTLGDKTVEASDGRYFRLGEPLPPGQAGQPREQEVWHLMEIEKDPARLRELKAELDTYPLLDMPSLKHSNPEVIDYLVESYSRYVDRGIEVFRVDAIKHIPVEAMSQFINRMNAYAASKGKTLIFINEYLTSNAVGLNVFAGDLLQLVAENRDVYFLDMPFKGELRRISTAGYRMDWLMGFVRHREANQKLARHFIPMVEDHDLGGPLKSAFHGRLIYALSDFFSYNPTVLHHGSEAVAVRTSMRDPIQAVNPQGDVALIRKQLTAVMEPYRSPENPPALVSHLENEDRLIVEKRLTERSAFVAVNKGDAEFVQQVTLEAGLQKLLPSYQEGGAQGTLTALGQLELRLPPHSYLILEITR